VASTTFSRKFREAFRFDLMEAGTRELYIVLALMAVIFIFAVGAVIIFIRQWRKEHQK
jgi:hypothetical protein